MANPLQQFGSEVISGLLGDVNVRDYQHASRTFYADNSARMPKFKSWFHVYFEFNQLVENNIRASLGVYNGPNNRFNWFTSAQDESVLGILVKNVRLPSYKFDVKQHNQYNRKNLAVNKMHYEPIEVTFHDDVSNIVRDFWYGYYQYYNQDPRYTKYTGQNQGVKVPDEWTASGGDAKTTFSNVYDAGIAKNWGLDTMSAATDENPTAAPGLQRTTNALKAIRIYQFMRSRTRPPAGAGKSTINNARYSEFVLVNPVITSFAHDTMDYSENGFATHTMTVDYETVLYNSGSMGANEIASWAEVQKRFFDITPSPLGTNVTSTLFGTGGFSDSLSNLFAQLEAGNFAAAAVIAARVGVKAKDIKAIATGDINQSVRNALAAISAGKGVGFPAIGP